jgi:radical SAM/Cys-rich protein
MARSKHSLASEVTHFSEVLEQHDLGAPIRDHITTLQVNLGKRCNMSCRHCHVEASPRRAEVLEPSVARQVIALLERSPQAEVLDLTGGAPELSPSFRYLVRETRRLGREVLDRCNLTVLLEPGQEDLADFLADQQAHVVASLPCYLSENVDQQRGAGAYERSIEALRRLNALGYGDEGSGLLLDLVYNPLGAFLPPQQARLQASYTEELGRRFGIRFNQLFTITNMPIARFAEQLRRQGKYDEYSQLLRQSFNQGTVPGLMCRSTVSVSHDGALHDCDFNQMLALPLASDQRASSIFDLDSLDELQGSPIATDDHCFGCTAGAGSSCTGALD